KTTRMEIVSVRRRRETVAALLPPALPLSPQPPVMERRVASRLPRVPPRSPPVVAFRRPAPRRLLPDMLALHSNQGHAVLALQDIQIWLSICNCFHKFPNLYYNFQFLLPIKS